MKKNSLTTAVVAGIAGVAGLANVATAVNLNPDGLGQVLIYPYYTVNAGNATLLSVVNTTDEVKAVKVRFLEALNSREVLDFNLYLSPWDVWTASVVSSADANGPARVVTTDTSCTVPAIPAAGEAFRNFAYTGSFDDDGPNGLERTREGHIEMIEMGVVEDTNGSAFSAATSFADAATHVDGVPASCATLISAWNNGIWSANPTAARSGASLGVSAPEGGLFGAAVIADVANGIALSYNADAIDGFYRSATGTTTLHTGPGFTVPSLAQAQTDLGVAEAIVFDNGNLITLDFVSGRPDAVSAVFMHDAIYNEYNTDAAVGASSEWVVTFPTKRLHIESTTPAARRPFTDNVDDSPENSSIPGNANDTLVFDPNGSCELIGVAFYDREEGPEAPAPVIDFSPLPEGEEVSLSLCWETNVVTWNQEAAVTAGESEVLGSRKVANNINLRDASGNDVTAGWIAMDFDVNTNAGGERLNFLLDGTDTTGSVARNQLFGLPVTGFWAANFINANAAPGTLANYSVLSKHRASRDSRGVFVTVSGGVETITATGFAAS